MKVRSFGADLPQRARIFLRAQGEANSVSAGRKLWPERSAGNRYKKTRRSPVGFPKQSESPLRKTNCWPSCDHAASLARMSPSLRGEPAGTGTVHKGVAPVPDSSVLPTKSWERSGEISRITMFLMGVGITEASPPVVET